jgi:hypothetical protein
VRCSPWFVLTVDTFFVGDIGRPDLGGPSAANDFVHAASRQAASGWVEMSAVKRGG